MSYVPTGKQVKIPWAMKSIDKYREGFDRIFAAQAKTGLITPEQALELIETPSDLSPAARLDVVTRLLDPTIDEDKEA